MGLGPKSSNFLTTEKYKIACLILKEKYHIFSLCQPFCHHPLKHFCFQWSFHFIFPGLSSQRRGKNLLIPGVLHSWSPQPRRMRYRYLLGAVHTLCLTQIHTMMTIFLQCRLLWRFSSGSFWRWRKLMEMHPQRRRSALWCKKVYPGHQWAHLLKTGGTTSPACQPWPRHHQDTAVELFCSTVITDWFT